MKIPLTSSCAATAVALAILGASPAARAQDATMPTAQPATAEPAPTEPTAPATPALQPSIASTLSAAPVRVDAGPLGPLWFGGIVSGLVQGQSHATANDHTWQADLGNAQVFVNKADGMLQFFLQAGYYSVPVLGVPYQRADRATPALFNAVPQGYLKLALSDSLSIQAGKLPTLIGAESTFTFQNLNIQRGLLWNQENAVNRGVQVNYASGPLTLSASVNDGFYSQRYNWVSALASYAFDDSNTLTFSGGASTRRSDVSTTATPVLQNNQQIYNLIYAHTQGAWTLQPYVQFTHVPSLPTQGTGAASTYGAALLMSYDFGNAATPAALRLPGFKLPLRLEYIASTGDAASGAANLLYGPGSAAWSLTLTPTYQYQRFFARVELSYVGARKTAPGLAFGADGNRRGQVRGVLEVGMLM
ncbi:outer membrane beta-barrel protein [Cupriavidus malaysiensis]|uniref:outer membrane beta-barrel protein n=1 Tax=Cupriavidus malaysiensis TaxID=367825 RepID=UPI001F390261|nr:outer membrane beta-barrel protein [Cupriavidus malaysiensis]